MLLSKRTEFRTIFTAIICVCDSSTDGLPHVKLRCVGDKMYGAYWSDAEVNLHCAYRRQIRSKASSTLLAISLVGSG